MKKIVLMAAGILLSVVSLCAQTNNTLVVFSEGGERFYLILNGLRQNETAATNVKAVGLNQSVYKAKVIFEQKGIADADKSLYMAWEGNPASNMEFVCSIKKDKKGNYKWAFVSTAPISASSPYASIQPSYPGGSASTTTTVSSNDNTQVATNVNTNTNVNTAASTNGTIGMNTSVGVNDNTSNNSSTTVTTSTTTTQGTNGVNMGVNMNGTGININMNISDPLLTGSSQTTTTTTSTTTTYTSSTTSGTGNPTTTTTYSASSTTSGTGNPNTITTTTNYSDNSYANMSTANNASKGCGWEMNSSDFASAKKSIAAKSFEDSKLTVAKQILNSNCLNTSQVKEIMDQFTFEQTRLDWAKFAYTKTTDRNNYFKINDGFTFEASIDELNDYISKVK